MPKMKVAQNGLKINLVNFCDGSVGTPSHPTPQFSEGNWTGGWLNHAPQKNENLKMAQNHPGEFLWWLSSTPPPPTPSYKG